MKPSHLIYLVCLLTSTTLTAVPLESAALQQIRTVPTEDTVQVYTGADLFTSYKVGKTQKYPYFYPVNGPISGISVTTESSEPYPHHASLFFGCDKVNGGNYWQESLDQGQIRSTSLRIIEAEGNQVVLENTCEWLKPGEVPVLRDMRHIRIAAPGPDLRIIDFKITLTPLTDIRIERTNHSLFAARMTPELSVVSGGTLVNTHGDTGEAETFGKAAPWCDYTGSREGITEGLAIFQHPANLLYPAPWFTRDYGFFSPTPMYWPPNGSYIELNQNEIITLRYRVVVHAGDTKKANIAALYAEYARQSEPDVSSASNGQ